MDDHEAPPNESEQDALFGQGQDARAPEARLAADILLAEYEHFGEMFRWNEETGERRVNIILTLFTVAGAATALLFSGDVDLPPGTKARVAGGISLSLFIIGVVTLARLVRRNVATDEYKHVLNTIRDRLVQLAPERLAGYRPFPQGPGSRLVRYLGLTLFMSSINSVLLAASALLLVGPSSIWASVALAAATFIGALVLQGWSTRRLQAYLEKALGLK